MNLSDLRTRAHIHLQKRSDVSTADLDQAVNDALRELAVGRYRDALGYVRLMHFSELQTSADTSLVSGQDAYAYPSNAYSISFAQHEYTSGSWLRLQYKRHRNLRIIQPVSGRPFCYSTHGRYIYLRNVPGADEASTTLRIYFYRYPTALTSDGDTPEIPAVWHPLLAIRAGAMLAWLYGLEELGGKLDAHFANTLANIRLPSEMDHTELDSRRAAQ